HPSAIMVQETSICDSPDNKCQLDIKPLAGVAVNDAAARLQSRGDASDDNIFEILPRFCISPEEGNCKWVRKHSETGGGNAVLQVVAAAGSSDVTAIAMGCDLVVFERDKDKPVKKMNFNDHIDFVLWRRSILLIGLKLDNDAKAEEPFFVDAFIHSNPDPTKLDVIVVSRCGQVGRFPDISLSDGSLDNTHDQNISVDIDLGTVKALTRKLNPTSKIVCATSSSRHELTVVEENGRISVFDLGGSKQVVPSIFVVDNLFMNLCMPLNKLGRVVPKKVMSFEGVLFVLFTDGNLQLFLSGSMFPSNSLNLLSESQRVHDFTLVMNNEGIVKLWVLYGSQPSGCENYVGIFSGTAFCPEFLFKLPLLQNSENYSELAFPRNVSPFEEPFTIIEMTANNVQLYHMLETSTDATMQKLISRGQYSKAEELALAYDKDLDIVRKAEARDILNKITTGHLKTEGQVPGRDTDYKIWSSLGFFSFKKILVWLDSLYVNLLCVLRSIKDAEFICNFHSHSKLPKIEWIKEIIELGKSRVYECTDHTVSNLLLLAVNRLHTFDLVYPNGTTMEWYSMISDDNNMFLQSIKFLDQGNYDKCEKIWRRHSEEFVPSITLAEFLPFFNSLFEHQLQTRNSVQLLKTILPFAVGKVAKSTLNDQLKESANVGTKELNVLLSLILRQVSKMETHVSWPSNALSFVKVLSSVIKDQIKYCGGSEGSELESPETIKLIMQKISTNLDHLEVVLGELADLKSRHSIRIAFQEYSTNDIAAVVNHLLYNLLSRDEVESFVSKFLRPYAERKNCNIDFLFAAHIKSVLLDIPYFIQSINIPHEERIVCLVHLFESHKLKLQSVLHISEEWPVPWSIGIDKMVQEILESCPRNGGGDQECMRLYESIRIMRKQVPYRCVLNKYKLIGTKLLKTRCNITMALLKILKLKKPGYYEDCKELLNNIPGIASMDDFRLDYLDLILKMYDPEVSEEELIECHQIDSKFGKALLHRVFLELEHFETEDALNNLYTQEEQERFKTIYSLQAFNSKDQQMYITSKLKRFLPSIPLDVVYSSGYPYCLVTHVFSDSKTPSKILEDCKTISRITQSYFADILIALGFYYSQASVPGNQGATLWQIVEQIVKNPLSNDINNSFENHELLKNACSNICTVLMFQCPSYSLGQMDILQQFLCRISDSFDKLCEDIGQMLCYLKIFLVMKEQEIPLEQEFMEVFKWLSGSPIKWEVVKNRLAEIGETLLKFGETDINFSVFRAVRRHLIGFLARVESNGGLFNHYSKIVEEINGIYEDLSNRTRSIVEDEPDMKIRRLVDSLNKAGVRVNSYALKMRNKVKLLERLISMKNYALAAQLAMTFSFYENLKCWSSILRGFMSTGDLIELRKVLLGVRTIRTLWMLPEFAEAWKRVAETDSQFYDMCPIPLDSFCKQEKISP
ncbi:Kinetochore-associated protein 1, partial [Orchesella cincta]